MKLVTENKKYLDRFLFYFYFYFAPSTQIFLKISRKTFYKKKLALMMVADWRPSLSSDNSYLTSSLKPLNGMQRNLTGRKISTSSTKLVFFSGRSEIRDILIFFSATAERNSTKLDRKQDLNVFYQVCVFRVDRKKKQEGRPASNWLRLF